MQYSPCFRTDYDSKVGIYVIDPGNKNVMYCLNPNATELWPQKVSTHSNGDVDVQFK